MLLYYEYINGVLGKESHSLPIDYKYVIRASETMIIDWQCIAFPILFRKVISLWYVSGPTAVGPM